MVMRTRCYHLNSAVHIIEICFDLFYHTSFLVSKKFVIFCANCTKKCVCFLEKQYPTPDFFLQDHFPLYLYVYFLPRSSFMIFPSYTTVTTTISATVTRLYPLLICTPATSQILVNKRLSTKISLTARTIWIV